MSDSTLAKRYGAVIAAGVIQVLGLVIVSTTSASVAHTLGVLLVLAVLCCSFSHSIAQGPWTS